MRPLILVLAWSVLLLAGSARADWSYTDEVDPMTSKKVFYATTDSVNSLSLESPYAGRKYGHLTVRLQDGANNVYVEIDKGQFVGCVTGCPIMIRFDERPPVRFQGRGPADYSGTTVFVLPAGQFISLAKGAKMIRFQANIYKAGAPVLEFQANALTWPPAKK